MPQASRLRLVVLVHMPLGDRPADDEVADARTRERAVLSVAASVVTTSAWTRRRLLELYALPADRVHVAEPGVDAADLATGTAAGRELLCVAAVTPDKGHDVLLDALATTADLSWHCVCVGSLDRDPAFVDGLRRRARGRRDRRPGALPGTADRSRPRAQLRRRGRAGAGVARRDLRHGRHRGAGARPAGRRSRGRRVDRGPRSRRRRDPARGCWFRPTIPRRSAPRSGRGSPTPSCGNGRAAPPASAASRSPGGRPPRPPSRASWPGPRDDCRGASGSAGNGSPSASLPTPRPVPPTSSNSSGDVFRRPVAR